MRKEYKPKPINLIGDPTLYIFVIIISILSIGRISLYIYLLILGVFTIIRSIWLFIQLNTYNSIIFGENRLTIIKGLIKKNKYFVNYDSISVLFDTNEHFSELDSIFLKHKIKNYESSIKIYHSYFSNEQFRDIHSEFKRRLPQYKIKFHKGYYNL